jgi:integrase
MPRLKNQPPAYRLHKSTGQAVVSFQGKRHYLGPHNSKASKIAYDRIVDQWRVELAELERQRQEQADREQQKQSFGAVPDTVTDLRKKAKAGARVFVVQLAKCYVDFASTYYVKNGEVTREAELVHEVCNFLSEHYGLVEVGDFGPVLLEEFRERMIDEKDWSRKYINNQCSRIIRMFRWGTSQEIVPPAVRDALRALAGLKKGRCRARETAPVPPVPDKVVDATLPYLSKVVADMVRFQRLTGCRPGEVCSIRPCDVDRSDD